MSDHAFLAPSSAARIMACNGSAQVEARYPDEVTQDSMEGSAVHWAAAARLLTGIECYAGNVADNGIVLNVEMCDAASMYAEWVLETCPPGVAIHVEERVVSAALHTENWGTPDCWFYDPNTMTLHVFDLKYGHRWVDVWMNWQLMNYAALILKHLWLYGDDRINVHMHICQPRSYHRDGPKRSWPTTLGKLREPLRRLSAAFIAASVPGAVVSAADPSQCLDCKGRYECEAATNAAYYGVDISTQSTPLEMSPAALARERRILMRAEVAIKARREGIDQHIERTIRMQRSVPGFYIAHKPGRTVWAEGAQAAGVVEMAKVFGVNVVKGLAMITPLQAIDAGMPADIVKALSRTNSGASELVEDDGSAAARMFE